MRLLTFAVLLASCAHLWAGDSDLKLKTRTTHTHDGNIGRSNTRSLYVKGEQQRIDDDWSAYGPAPADSTTTIYDCGGKRMVLLNRVAKTYFVQPYDPQEFEKQREKFEADVKAGKIKSIPVDPNAPVLTITLNTKDTGERREVNGFTLRHIVETETRELRGAEMRPQDNVRTERDGWYVDAVPQQVCGGPQQRGYVLAVLDVGPPHERLEFKHTGNALPARQGVAIETVTQTSELGRRDIERTELLELSNAPLSPTLFDIPQGYSKAQRLPHGGVDMQHRETLWGTIVAYWRDFWYTRR